MQSTDVVSKYQNMHSSPTGDIKLVDIGDFGSCRIFSVVWCPFSLDEDEHPRVQIWSGDPSDGSSSILYEDGTARGGESNIGSITQAGQPFMDFSPSPANYFLSEKDVWVRGVSPGVRNVTVTYQLGG
tara:strand:+ start:4683 stop:5066 length:384 start_codon:yes stop_codon:yes gene_type:complete